VRRRSLARTLGPALGAVLALAGCTSSPAEEQPAATPTATSPGPVEGTLTVFAAASLTDVFTELGGMLEDDHPGLAVQFTFAGSSTLLTQLTQGAPADVFAPAAERQMEQAEGAGLVEESDVFARNPLMLAVPADNPAGIVPPDTGPELPRLAEILPEDVVMAVCAPEVPCGEAAAELLEKAGLSDVPDTYEDDVRAVLTKVQLGEVDAGLVYLSDVWAAGSTVRAYDFREAPQAINRYRIGALADAPNPAAAQAFVELVLSEEGQAVLREARFLEP
jgi:molybdate transport system substrate-binding protein